MGEEIIENKQSVLEDELGQLRERVKELEAFNYTVAHDLSAPLSRSYAYSWMVLKNFGDEIGEEGAKQLRGICQASVEGKSILNGLMRLARVSGMELKQRSVDVTSIAKEILESYKRDEPMREVLSVVEPDIRVWGDESMLKIVLENLLGNAWKFTERKVPARIEVVMECVRGEAALVVKDNGVGFDSKDAEGVFKVFHRLYQDDDVPGCGIGLETVKRIIDRHSGKVWAKGRRGEGAAFYVVLPMK